MKHPNRILAAPLAVLLLGALLPGAMVAEEEIVLGVDDPEIVADAGELEIELETLPAEVGFDPALEESLELVDLDLVQEDTVPEPDAAAEVGNAVRNDAEGDVPIDAAHFPDSQFRSYVSDYCDSNWDGILSAHERKNVFFIDISDYGLTDLKGIELFPELIELICSNNQLTSLDMIGYTALRKLFCSGNPLTSLDVSGCTALVDIDCPDQLTSLKASGCTALGCFDWRDKQLTSLDVSGCISLTCLYCDNNQLTSLDVSACTSLTDLECSGNQLTSLDVSGYTSLGGLSCDNNNLTSLNVNGCTSLAILNCSNNQLTSLDVSGCTSLQTLIDHSNPLTSLNVSGCTSLTELHYNDRQLTSLDISGCQKLSILECGVNQLTILDLSGCTSLSELSCHHNRLSILDLSKCTGLSELWCDDNQLTELDVSGCTSLSNLYCYNNRLTELDLTDNKTLVNILKNNEMAIDSASNRVYVHDYGDRWIYIDATTKITAGGKTLYDPSGSPTAKPTAKPTSAPDKTSIKKCTISGIKAQVYTGKAIKPKPVVKHGKKTLKKGTDYTLTYSNNKKIGTATVTVKGKGQYTGSVKKTFKINPKAVKLSSLTAGKKQLTAKWKKGSGGVSYELQYGLKKSFSDAKSITVKKASTVKKVIKDLTAGKTYYVRIRAFKKVDGKKYVSAWSDALSAKVK